MEENKNVIEELKLGWRELALELRKHKRLDLTRFKNVYAQTYAMLLKHAGEGSVQKDEARVIAEAFLFAHTDAAELDKVCIAAFVLTERMLNACAFQTNPALCEMSSIYVIEERKDLCIRFGDVDDALSQLSAIMERR